jgi:hypothetical protein
VPSGSNSEATEQEQQLEPFFPAAFAVSPDRPTDFNFQQCFYNTPCRLQLELRPDCKAVRRVTTLNNSEAVAALFRKWYQKYMERLQSQDRQESSDAEAWAARRRLKKNEIFLKSGRPMDGLLKFGKPPADDNLWAVRLDIMGNVMVWGAPQWSDCSVQFTHGFPRKLVTAAHGGYTEGNVTCTSRITNEMIRSTADGDIIAFCMRNNLQACGLHPAVVHQCRKAEFSIIDKSLPCPARVMESTFR